ncbi:hypothetical protein [Chlamydiifrater volucris]|uniref:hypothetical protein n=1 Tax=Chlamydiifrater volucris TaxID=2681470 RepID=UPI001BCB9442|nr:hypothetical protein [Chlamydiifrater volucris]
MTRFFAKIIRVSLHFVIVVSTLLPHRDLMASDKLFTVNFPRGEKFNTSSGATLNGEFKGILDKKSPQDQWEFFQLFLEAVKKNSSSFSVQEFVTVANLAKDLASSLVKDGTPNKAVEVIKNTLRIPGLPKQARTELFAYLQTLNPEKLSLPQLVDRLFGLPKEVRDKLSWKDSLLMDVCKLALLGDYTNRKYEVEQAFSSEKYSESLILAERLLEDISKDKVYLEPYLLKLEKACLLKIRELSNFFLAKKEGKADWELINLMNKVCLKEKNYAEALSDLLALMARGEVPRSWELDRVLFSDALNRSVSSLSDAIKELEVLTDRGLYLSGSIACNGYFKLLEWYLISFENDKLDKLLKVGEKEFFKEDSPYYSSYLFFLGASAYQRGAYAEACSILEEGLKKATGSCCFLADIWECLGCSLLRQSQHVRCQGQRKHLYSQAGFFFLKAYKNWARVESGVAWFLCKALQGDQESCTDFVRKEIQSMPFKEKNMTLNLYELFFSPPEEPHIYPFSLRKEKNIQSYLRDPLSIELMTLYEEIFASLVCLLPSKFEIKQREEISVLRELLDFNTSNKRSGKRFNGRTSLFSDEILSLIEETISFENTEKIGRSLREGCWETPFQEALNMLSAIRKKDLRTVDSFSNKYLSVASQCYAACVYGKKVIIDPSFFQEVSPLVRSYLFLIISKIPHCFDLCPIFLFETIFQSGVPYGDRLFFLLHPHFIGESSSETIYAAASYFPKKFPFSAFSSIAYYLSSLGRKSLEEKEGDLRKAVMNLVDFPYGLGKDAATSHARFIIRLALASVLMEKNTVSSLADATCILEELKEEIFSPTHPATISWRSDNPLAFYKAGHQVGSLLAKCYSLQNEEAALLSHLVESLENNLLLDVRMGKYFDGTLAASEELGEMAATTYYLASSKQHFS